MTRRLLILVGLGLTLATVTAMVIQKELLLRNGTSVYLELAPVDPRSLIQGDYMTLRYAIAGEVGRSSSEPTDGFLVLTLDARSVASFRRIHVPGTELAPDERLLRYRVRGSVAKLGAEAYYFQEGRAEVFEKAAYGELKVTASGQSVLVGLRDRALTLLK